MQRQRVRDRGAVAALCRCGTVENDAAWNPLRQVVPRGAVECEGRFHGRPYSLATEGDCVFFESTENDFGVMFWRQSDDNDGIWARRVCNNDSVR